MDTDGRLCIDGDISASSVTVDAGMAGWSWELSVMSQAVLIAVGIDFDGRRQRINDVVGCI